MSVASNKRRRARRRGRVLTNGGEHALVLSPFCAAEAYIPASHRFHTPDHTAISLLPGQSVLLRPRRGGDGYDVLRIDETLS